MTDVPYSHKTFDHSYMNGSCKSYGDVMRRMVFSTSAENRPFVIDSCPSPGKALSFSRGHSTARSSLSESLQRLINILEIAESVVELDDEEVFI